MQVVYGSGTDYRWKCGLQFSVLFLICLSLVPTGSQGEEKESLVTTVRACT